MPCSAAAFRLSSPTVLFLFAAISASSSALELDLHAAVELALRNNRDIRNGLIELQTADKRLGAPILDRIPSVTVGISGSGRTVRFSPDSRSCSFTLAIEQILFNGGETGRELEDLRHEMSIRTARHRHMETSIILLTVSRYARVLGLIEKLHITEQQLQAARRQLSLAEKEYSQGELPELELLLLRISVGLQETLLLETEQELKKARLDFRTLLGLEKDPELTGRLNTDYSGFLDPSPAETYIDLMEARSPEFMDMRMQIHGLSLRLEQWWLYRVPVITLLANLDMAGEDIENLNLSFSAGLRFDVQGSTSPAVSFQTEYLPPFQRSIHGSGSVHLSPKMEALRDREDLIQRLTALEEEYAVMVEKESMNVESLLLDITASKERLELGREKLLVLQRRATLAEKQLAQGEITRSEFLESRAVQANHNLELLQEIIDLFTAELELMMTAGLSPDMSAIREIML